MVALGERPGEELFDRPVEGRGEDEDDRPEDDDLAVLVLAEAPGGEDEEDVGEDAAEAECDGEARRRAPVGAGLASDAAPASLRSAPFRSRTGSSSRPSRAGRTIRRGVRARKRRIISIIRRPMAIAASGLPVADEVPTRGR